MDTRFNLDLKKLIDSKEIVSPGLQMNQLLKKYESISKSATISNETNAQEEKLELDSLFQDKSRLLSKTSNESPE